MMANVSRTCPQGTTNAFTKISCQSIEQFDNRHPQSHTASKDKIWGGQLRGAHRKRKDARETRAREKENGRIEKRRKNTERYCDRTEKQKNSEGEQQGKGDECERCEFKGVNSQGWMVESREEQKPERMKMGSKHDTTTNTVWLKLPKVVFIFIIFGFGPFPHFHAKKFQGVPFFCVENSIQTFTGR